MKKSATKNKHEMLTTEKVPVLITKLAVPTIISMLVTSLYNLADTYFVGTIDTQSTAAVGIVFSVMAIIQAFGFFFGQGSGNFISRRLGARDLDAAARMAATGFYSSLIFGTLLGIVGLIFLTPLSRILGSTPTILPYTQRYLGIILLGSPFMMASLVLNNQMRFQGNAHYSMIGIVSGAVINVALDPLFIFGFDMGVSGAALSTVTSQVMSFIILLRMTRRGGNLRIYFRNFTPTRSFLREIVSGGTPSFTRQGLHSVATILLNVAAGVYGDAAIAAMSIVMRINGFINSFVVGFGQGFQPVCGFNYGAGLYRRVREGFWFCIKVGTLFLTAVGLAGIGFAADVISLFREGDAEVTAIGVTALQWLLATSPLNATITMSNMFLQTIRKPVQATLISSGRQGLFFIPLILILPRVMGLKGVQICQSLSDILTFAMAIPLCYTVMREMMRKEKTAPDMAR